MIPYEIVSWIRVRESATTGVMLTMCMPYRAEQVVLFQVDRLSGLEERQQEMSSDQVRGCLTESNNKQRL